MREKSKTLRRIQRLRELGLSSEEISAVLKVPSRTVRHYASKMRPVTVHTLRTSLASRDITSIERLSECKATIEEISDILELSGKVIFRVLKHSGRLETQNA